MTDLSKEDLLDILIAFEKTYYFQSKRLMILEKKLEKLEKVLSFEKISKN